MTRTISSSLLERSTGRLLACCCHPAAAWRVVTPGERGLIVSVYVSAAYALVLGWLLLTS